MEQGHLVKLFTAVIVANELDNDLAYALKFTDPDGVRSGKSGYSFAVCQFDIANNPVAAACLRACGFTPEEIAGLKAQCIPVRPLEAKLRKNAALVEKYSSIQLRDCLTRATGILRRRGINAADDTALLAVADYHNQYYLSDIDRPGYLVHYLGELVQPFTAQDVLDFKLDHTRYGKTHPGDCQRRYNNLIDIVAKG
ncbi:MAG TPA: hypothetical protein DCP69_07965 [Candidatus Omnitrophica bacterium]|nr:hypothetical protein [Candidatus Omnitrophota bacterium]